AAQRIAALPEETRVMLAFVREATQDTAAALAAELVEDGFVRALVGGQTLQFAGQLPVLEAALQSAAGEGSTQVHVIVDRVTGGVSPERLRDSLETALNKGDGQCV